MAANTTTPLNQWPPEWRKPIVDAAIKQVSESDDFDFCKSYYMSYVNYHKMGVCHKPMISRLFNLCFNGRIIDAGRAKEVCSLLRKGYTEYNYFSTLFHDFDERYVAYYNASPDSAKEKIIEKETKEYIVNEPLLSIILELYDYLTPAYPELSVFICETAMNKCIQGKNVKDNEGRTFIRKFGTSNKYSRRLLWKHLGNVLLTLIWTLILLIGFILIMTHTDLWWVIALLIPACLALGTFDLQYLFKLFSAIANFFKTEDFNFDTTVVGYVKNSDGTGSYRVIRDKDSNKKEK